MLVYELPLLLLCIEVQFAPVQRIHRQRVVAAWDIQLIPLVLSHTHIVGIPIEHRTGEAHLKLLAAEWVTAEVAASLLYVATFDTEIRAIHLIVSIPPFRSLDIGMASHISVRASYQFAYAVSDQGLLVSAHDHLLQKVVVEMSAT